MGNLDELLLSPEEAVAAADSMVNLSESILSTLESVKQEMSKVDNEDEMLYFNTGGASSPAALREELDENSARFNLFNEQVVVFADFVKEQVKLAQQQ